MERFFRNCSMRIVLSLCTFNTFASLDLRSKLFYEQKKNNPYVVYYIGVHCSLLYNFVSYICISHHLIQDTQAFPKSNIPHFWATIFFSWAIGLTLSAETQRTELSLRESKMRGVHRWEVPTEYHTTTSGVTGEKKNYCGPNSYPERSTRTEEVKKDLRSPPREPNSFHGNKI